MTLSNPTTISVDIEQLQHLQNIAQRQGNSLNETLHEIIHLGIDALQHRKQQRLDALKHLTQIRQDIAQTQGKYPGDILGTIREERMQR
jgi:predicted negative regulator of RcsB-dependent stress response